MRIFITGATGMVGQRLVADRLARGDTVTALSRSADKARARLPEAVAIVEGNPAEPGDWQRAVDGQDAIVHLAGAGIADRRWTPSYKRLLVTSRVDSAHQLVEAVRAAARRPSVMVGASAVGWYPDGGDQELDEGAPRNAGDFLGDLCGAWEAAATPVRDLGLRLVHLRIGLVLAPEGGMIGKLAPIFRLFLGGPIGLGRAWMPWVHWADVIGLADHAMRTAALDEPMNATAPNPVRNAEFTRALASALGRPALLPVPPPALRVALGEFGRYANVSQRVVPRVALDTGYSFRHRDVHEAMRSLFTEDAGATDPSEGPQPVSEVAPKTTGPSGATRSGGNGGNGGGGAGAGRGTDGTSVGAKRVGADPASAESGGDPRPARPIRLVAVPLEHGLLEHGRMPAGAVAACRAAAEAGCRVVIATGRPPRGTLAATTAAGVADTVIACNGALIWNHREGQAVHHEPLDAATAAEALSVARAAAPTCLVGIDRLDRWYTDRLQPGAPDPSPDDGAAPAGVGPLEQWLDEAVTQVDLLVAADDLAAVRQALEPLVAARRLARYERPGGLFQLTSPRAEKAVALQRLARGAGLDRSEVMAVGGGRHDAGMVEWAGFGVALGDAPAPVRRLADVVVADRAAGGVARALARYVVSQGGGGSDGSCATPATTPATTPTPSAKTGSGADTGGGTDAADAPADRG